MRQLTLPRLVVSVVCVAASSTACGIGVGEDFRECAALPDIDLEGVAGESTDNRNVVEVVADVVDGRGQITVTQVDTAVPFGPIRFGLAGKTLDTLVPPVVVEFGDVFVGEGSEFGYVRVVDDVGLFFEGGRTFGRDDGSSGGSRLDSPLTLGDVVKTCAADGDLDDHDDGGTVHDVAVAFDDGAQQVATGDVVDGVIGGVDVTAVAGQATRVDFYSEGPVADGYDAGAHTQIVVEGYVFRRAP